MRDLVADALRAVDADLDELLPMQRLDPPIGRSSPTGRPSGCATAARRCANEIADTCGSVDAAAFDGFVDWLQELYVAEMPHFIDRNFDSPLDLLSRPDVAAKLVRLGGFGRLGNAIRRRFRDDRLHRLFSFQAMYAGLAPDEALAIYAVITYMDSIEGVWFPEGGMHAVPWRWPPPRRRRAPSSATAPRCRRCCGGPTTPGSPAYDSIPASSCAPTRSSAPSTCRPRTRSCCPT